MALDGAGEFGCSYPDVRIEYYHDVRVPWLTALVTQAGVIERQF